MAVNFFQNVGRRHLGFLHYVNFGGKSDCGTPFSTYVSNSVQMRAKMAELWQKCDFQYGGRRHVGFCAIRVLRVKAAQGPYSRCLYQSWCKSIQKWRSYGHLTFFQNGGRRHLGFFHYVNFGGKSDCGTPFPI